MAFKGRHQLLQDLATTSESRVTLETLLSICYQKGKWIHCLYLSAHMGSSFSFFFCAFSTCFTSESEKVADSVP